jgi:hypothetical protein
MRTQIYLYFFLSFFCSRIAFAETLKVGIVEFPPHIDFSTKASDATVYKYINEILEGLVAKVEFKTYSHKQALIELNSGAIDLLFPLDVSQNKLRHLSKPLFHVVPGLCFTKNNFIPVLSALHRLKDLNIAVASGAQVLDVIAASGANVTTLTKENKLQQGVDLLLANKIDAVYLSNPEKIYHYNNPLSKQIACSKFHGYPSGIYVAVRNNMSEDKYQLIDRAFTHALEINSYENFFDPNRVKQ